MTEQLSGQRQRVELTRTGGRGRVPPTSKTIIRFMDDDGNFDSYITEACQVIESNGAVATYGISFHSRGILHTVTVLVDGTDGTGELVGIMS